MNKNVDRTKEKDIANRKLKTIFLIAVFRGRGTRDRQEGCPDDWILEVLVLAPIITPPL